MDRPENLALYPTFNVELLRLCGDISTNPGTQFTKKCSECGRIVSRNHRATWCDGCSSWSHSNCGGILPKGPKEYQDMKSNNNISRICGSCLELLHQFRFADTSLNSSSISNAESALEENNTATSVGQSLIT